MLGDLLRQKGYRLVEFGDETDLLVLNTCSVTESAEKDCRYAVRKTLRHSPQAFVALTGCYAQTGAALLQSIPGVDLIVGTEYKMKLPDYLPAPGRLKKRPAPELQHSRTIGRDDFVLPGTAYSDSTRALLKIQDGCDFMCSFCQIPFARGRERSRVLSDVLREARDLTAAGYRELVLTGVNIGRYRHEGATLVDLLGQLEAVPGVTRIRISSIEPTTVTDDLLEHMARSSTICRYLHVPLQSGDDQILEAMNRRYSLRDFETMMERALELMPDAGFGTDLLVGFPGEDDEAFERTREAAARLPFSYFHVFSYSERPGTAAAKLDAALSPSTVQRRRQLLTELSRSKNLAFSQLHIGRRLPVLFEKGTRRGLRTGTAGNFLRVAVANERELAGTIQDVTITGIMDGLAVGALLSPASQKIRTPLAMVAL